MNTNYWQSRDNQNDPAKPYARRSGLLSNYGHQGQISANNPAPQGPPPSSPLPPAAYSVNQPAPAAPATSPYAPGGGPSQAVLPRQQQWNGPAFMARPMQIAQRISSKMAALRRSAPPVDPNPLVRYHPPQPPMVRPVPTR
ncbi:MAG TPA: hypothetical protein VKX46_14330, partial [Ktedonobacteraceae bacterium]|nr:hypothetical protein [Ktedonobacteraceae bacterium]